ncbi:MAG: transcription termination/antitermination protein NusA [Kiritimatiellae bacterium]|nr:transcription termination/antitermination protein NusA [Kiritimatiellia bacterium]
MENSDLKAMFDFYERDRKLNREEMCRVIESALQVAGRRVFAKGQDVRVTIDRASLRIRVFATKTVKSFVRDRQSEMSIEEADITDKANAPHKEGSKVEQEVPVKVFGRIAAQTAKQAIQQLLQRSSMARVMEMYKERVGELVSGTVRRFDRNDIVVDLGDAEGILPSRGRVNNEDYHVGDQLQFVLEKCESDNGGILMTLSRSSAKFIVKMFERDVTELQDGSVEIKSVAREAGYRTKLAVASRDDKIDPVGACVGLRGQRVKNIVRELNNEKVDIVKWSPDIKVFVANALAPAKLLKVDVDEREHTVKIVVDPEQLSLAIGKKGQNARLTAKLTGWKIDIKRQEPDRTFEEQVAAATAELAAVKGIGAKNAKLLVSNGFLTVEGIATADLADLADIEGFDAETAATVHLAAETEYAKQNG